VAPICRSLTLASKVGTHASSALKNPLQLGATFLGSPQGGVAEVYVGRCRNDNELASSIFHEAAHLKSGMDESMHMAAVGPAHGGMALHVLTATGSNFSSPSGDDLDFYAKAIHRQIKIRVRVP
jgi:hypothetical protein